MRLAFAASFLLCTAISQSASAQVVPSKDDPDFGSGNRPWQFPGAFPSGDGTPQPEVAQAPPPDKRWYGYWILGADIASVALLTSSGPGRDRNAPALGGMVLGGPLVHMAYRQPNTALLSFALRTGMTLGPMYVGAARCAGSSSEFCGYEGILLGVMGYIVAAGIDSFGLAWKEVPRKPVTGLSFVPTVAPLRGGGALGLSGVF